MISFSLKQENVQVCPPMLSSPRRAVLPFPVIFGHAFDKMLPSILD